MDAHGRSQLRRDRNTCIEAETTNIVTDLLVEMPHPASRLALHCLPSDVIVVSGSKQTALISQSSRGRGCELGKVHAASDKSTAIPTVSETPDFAAQGYVTVRMSSEDGFTETAWAVRVEPGVDYQLRAR